MPGDLLEQRMTATSVTPRVRPALIANLLGQIAFGLVIMTICLPSMQEWGRMFDTDQSGVQLTFSGYVAAYGVLQLLYGPLSDRYGRRPVLLLGLGLALAGSILGALAPNLGVLTLARVIQGAGGAAGMVVGRSMIHDWFVGTDRTRMMAYVGMAMGVCPPSATILGGYLHVHFGWQANFVLVAVLSALLLAAAWWGLPVQRPLVPGSASSSASGAAVAPLGWVQMLSAYGQLLKNRSFLMYMVILSCTTSAFYTMLGGAPIVLKSYGVGPDGVGFYIMFGPLSYIVGNFLTSHLVHRLGERRVMVWGQGITFSSVVFMVGLSVLGWKAPLAFALPLLLLGFGHGLLVPPALTGSIGLMPALAGSAAGAIGLMQQWVGAMGGYSVGWVSHEDATHLGLLMAIFATTSVLAQWRLNQLSRHAGKS
jgi:DHA1 family bicyclomycin/chloramphenicol resistance-like MFS transporter